MTTHQPKRRALEQRRAHLLDRLEQGEYCESIDHDSHACSCDELVMLGERIWGPVDEPVDDPQEIEIAMQNTTKPGDKVCDTVTGLVGIVTARTEYIHGCFRVLVQPQEVKDGRPVEPTYFDELGVEVLEAGAVRASVREQPDELTGGPRPDPTAKGGERR